MNYATFSSRLQALESWNPDTHLLQGDLTLKAKPETLSFCNLIKLSFTHARANNAVLATQNLHNWSVQFKKELKNDNETLLKVKKVNSKIYCTFVAGCENEHIIRNKSKRKKIQRDFFATRNKFKKKTKILKISRASQFDKFLMNFNPSTQKEAIPILKELNGYVDILTRKQANELLLKLRKIKRDFKQDGLDSQFDKAQLALCKKIRRRFFTERLKKNRQDLADLRENFSGSEDGRVYQLLEKWQNRLKKNKPIDFPKWFHCTPSKNINGLLASGKIEVRNQKAFKGAFASTQPEASYGAYCIALGSNIELEAKRLPLITNVTPGQFYIGPIAIGAKSKRYPSIWAGFKENLHLKRPNKEKDYLGHYARTNFVLLGQTNPFSKITYSAWLNGLSDQTKNDLTARKIDILPAADFEELLTLVSATFDCQLPFSWKDARDVKMHGKFGKRLGQSI